MVDSGIKWRKVVVDMLMGEYHHNIDDKNRMIIPSRYREDLGDTVVVTRGLEGCLFVYSLDEWNQIVLKLKALPFTKRMLEVLLDFSYRVQLSVNLINKEELR